MTEVRHVIPGGDVIEHAESEECVCGPTPVLVSGERGDGWVQTHHSLDGRELSEG